MSEPFNENSWWRYIIRSKDRLSGTPNNFVVQLPNPIPDNVSDIWVQVQYVAIDSFPNPNDTATVLAQNANSGLFNQGTFSTGNYNNYGFDTGCGVDVCISGVGTIGRPDASRCPRAQQPRTGLHTPVRFLQRPEPVTDEI